jgi:hypothetical protein
MIRAVSSVLVPALLLAFGSAPVASAQTMMDGTGDSISPVAEDRASSSDNETAQAILIGMFVVVVGILVVLGVRSDFGPSRRRSSTPPAGAYAWSEDRSLDDLVLGLEREDADGRVTVEVAGLGVRARF